MKIDKLKMWPQGILRSIAGIVLVSVFIPSLAFADNLAIPDHEADTPMPALQIHGFLTAGAAISNQKDVVITRDLSSRLGVSKYGNPLDADSRFGIQADYQVTPHVSTTLQTVAAPRVVQDANNYIPWAFVKYDFDNALYFRAGRMGTYYFALSDQRNVGYVYPWVRPPVELYGFLPIYSMNGVDFAWRRDFSVDESIQVRGFVSKADPTYFLPGNNLSDHADLEMSPMYGATVAYNNNDLVVRGSYLTTKIKSTMPGLDDALQTAKMIGLVYHYEPLIDISQNAGVMNTALSFYDASATYNDDSILILSEVSFTAFESHFKQNIAAGYLTLGWHVSPRILPFINYSLVRPTRTLEQLDVNTAPTGLPQLSDYLINTGYYDLLQQRQQTVSLGARYDFRDKYDLKVQVDKTKAYGKGYQLLDITGQSTPNSHGITSASITLDMVF